MTRLLTISRLGAGCLVAVATLTGCAGTTTAQSVAVNPLSCADLAGKTIAPSSIGLPTGGATVTGATAVGASGSGADAVGAFCRVTASIAPVDPAAPPVRMEVNLPEAWNGKALMYGGGGLNGSILSTAGKIRLQPPDMPIPLARGYATFGSDSGHSSNSADGSFAANDEALRNYAWEALKKTRDVAGVLIHLRYGRAPDKVYFHGSSNGGKEALAMVQKYPADLDGAMIFWPAINLGTLQLQFARIARALEAPGGDIDMAKRRLVLAAAVQACDRLDGVADGLISNSRRCQEVFDPATARYRDRPLRCASGGDEGEACLSDAQIHTLKTMATPFVSPRPLASGETQFPGFNVWGSDLGIGIGDSVSRTATQNGFGTLPAALPTKPGMPFIHVIADQYLKYFVTRDADATWVHVDPASPGAWGDRLSRLTAMLDMNQADLSAFYRHGGKILLIHGLSDQAVPPQSSEQYYDRVVGVMGEETVRRFLRFYEIAGVSHSGIGTAFTPAWDALGALDDWATKGQPPHSPVVADTYARPGRTRPLCEYPSYVRYAGGDADQASSFTCSR